MLKFTVFSSLLLLSVFSCPYSSWAREVRSPIRIQCDCYIETQRGLNTNPGSASGWGERICTEDASLNSGYDCSLDSKNICSRHYGMFAQTASCTVAKSNRFDRL